VCPFESQIASRVRYLLDFVFKRGERASERAQARLTENAARESEDVYNYASEFELQIRDV
jgi:hypothetical protein